MTGILAVEYAENEVRKDFEPSERRVGNRRGAAHLPKTCAKESSRATPKVHEKFGGTTAGFFEWDVAARRRPEYARLKKRYGEKDEGK